MSKDWYYAQEGNSVGPVTPEEFEALIASGTIRSDTLVWQEGMDDWLPLGRTGEGGNAAPPPPHAPDAPTSDPARADANSFVGALKDGFARYVDFRTRSTRSQFWYFTLWNMLLSFGASALDGILGIEQYAIISNIASLVLLLPSIAVGIRRLHDTGRVGWWYLLVLIPLIGWLFLIYFFVQRSAEGPNQWGPEPRH